MAMTEYDQKVYDSGYKYIPRSEFLLSPFKIPVPETKDSSSGIPSLIPRETSDGFNPYNTNMSNVRQDFNPYEARQAGEIYSGTFNPRSFDPSGQIKNAQTMYNKALQDINDPRPGAKGLNARTETFSGQPRLSQEMLDYYGEKILDNQERYRTQGQYVDPYDRKYSSMAEAQQFMNMNNPEYYGMPSYEEETGIPAAMRRYMQDSLIGKGLGAAKGFVENVLPFNERAVLEDQARASGIFTDDIGRIVTDDYNTAGGIMAGYNLNQIDEGSFDKRRGTIENTLGDKYGLSDAQIEAAINDPNYTGPGANLVERLGLLDEAEEDILNSRKKTTLVSKLRKDKKIEEKRQREEEQQIQDDLAAAAASKNKAAALAAIKKQGEADYNPNIHGQTNYGRDSQGNQSFDSGQGFGIGSDGGPVSNRTGRGRTGFMDGGRIYYMDGGLADLVDIYD